MGLRLHLEVRARQWGTPADLGHHPPCQLKGLLFSELNGCLGKVSRSVFFRCTGTMTSSSVLTALMGPSSKIQP